MMGRWDLMSSRSNRSSMQSRQTLMLKRSLHPMRHRMHRHHHRLPWDRDHLHNPSVKRTSPKKKKKKQSSPPTSAPIPYAIALPSLDADADASSSASASSHAQKRRPVAPKRKEISPSVTSPTTGRRAKTICGSEIDIPKSIPVGNLGKTSQVSQMVQLGPKVSVTVLNRLHQEIVSHVNQLRNQLNLKYRPQVESLIVRIRTIVSFQLENLVQLEKYSQLEIGAIDMADCSGGSLWFLCDESMSAI